MKIRPFVHQFPKSASLFHQELKIRPSENTMPPSPSQMYFLFLYFFTCTPYIYIYTYTTTTILQGRFIILCLYPWSHLDIQRLTATLTFKDHWPHDLHDLAERRSHIPRTIGHMIYMTSRKDV